MSDSKNLNKSSAALHIYAYGIPLYSSDKILIINGNSECWTYTIKKCINNAINKYSALACGKMYSVIGTLRERFSEINIVKTARAGALALALASFGPAANDAAAGEVNAATPVVTTTPGERGLDAVQGRDDMAAYSKDPKVQGIGVFINLREGSSVTGDQIGKWVQNQFAGINPPVSVDYRVNQSRGTATDVTFYVQDFAFTLNVSELQTGLKTILGHHRDVWLSEQQAATPRDTLTASNE